MRRYQYVLFGMLLILGLGLIGCGDNDSSPTTVTSTGVLEGQLVADAGAPAGKLAASAINATTSGAVYPLSGVTVELLQQGNVIATTTTDEYGRFRFLNVAPGEYDLRVTTVDGAVIHHHVTVNADQTLTVYGRVLSGECLWDQGTGPHWDDMSQGQHWGAGFCGAAPGAGYWHNGQEWCEPVGTGPHGPRS